MAVLDQGILKHVPVLTCFCMLAGTSHMLVSRPILSFFLKQQVKSLLNTVHIGIKY